MSAPRKRLNPALVDAVYASDRCRQLAPLVGLSHARFAALLEAETIVATPETVKRLHRIAAAVGFSRDRVFVANSGTSEVLDGE